MCALVGVLIKWLYEMHGATIKIKKTIIKTKCDSVNHTRFPTEDHLPYWACRDNKVTKDDRVDQDPVEMDFVPFNFRDIT